MLLLNSIPHTHQHRILYVGGLCAAYIGVVDNNSTEPMMLTASKRIDLMVESEKRQLEMSKEILHLSTRTPKPITPSLAHRVKTKCDRHYEQKVINQRKKAKKARKARRKRRKK